MGSIGSHGRACQRGRWIDCSLRLPLRGCVDAVHDIPCQVGPGMVPPQNWLPREWHTVPAEHGCHSDDRPLLRFYDRHSRCSRYLWRCVVVDTTILPIC